MKPQQLYVLSNLQATAGFQGAVLSLWIERCRVKKAAEEKLIRWEYKTGVSVNTMLYVKYQQLDVFSLIMSVWEISQTLIVSF